MLQAAGKPYDYEDLCHRMNPRGVPTTARPIVEHLSQFVDAERYNRGTISEIRREVDAGHGAILSVRYRDGEPHWIVLTGYRTDDSGGISEWHVIDSAWGRRESSGIASLSHQDLLARWRKPFGEAPIPLDDRHYTNYWIRIRPKSSLVASAR